MGETVDRQMDKHMKAITNWDKCWEENQWNVEIDKPGNIDLRLGRSGKALLRERAYMGRGRGKLGQSERVAWTYTHYQM